MRHVHRQIAAAGLTVAVLHLTALVPTLAASAARLEGLVVDVGGRPARGYQVHLIDGRGQAVAKRGTDDRGVYAFDGLRPGSYALGVESPAGSVAAVSAPAVTLDAGQLARRDVKLMQGDASQVRQATSANYGLGQWWAGLSPAAKAWTIIGIVAVAGVTAAALSDDDDESASSPAD